MKALIQIKLNQKSGFFVTTEKKAIDAIQKIIKKNECFNMYDNNGKIIEEIYSFWDYDKNILVNSITEEVLNSLHKNKGGDIDVQKSLNIY